MMTKTDIHKKAMIEALRSSLGIVSDACKTIDICRQQHYTWMKEDAEYKQAIEDISEEAIDFAETALRKRIESGDTTAIIFYLKTKGKSRGYIEKSEITHSGNIISGIEMIIPHEDTTKADS